MQDMRNYLHMFLEKVDFPEESRVVFLEADLSIKNNPNCKDQVMAILDGFNSNPKAYRDGEFLKELARFAEAAEVHTYTMHLLFYIYSSKELLKKYAEADISIDLFWNAMLDLRCKLLECYDVHGIWGTFVATWFIGFFSMERFALGRLQYEHVTFPYESYSLNEYTVSKGDTVYNIHIPSSGPLTLESRLDSYRRAYEFYKHELDGGPLVVVCNSWLLYPDNEKFYKEGSNIIDFAHDFEIIDSKDDETPQASWRIFGKDYQKPFDELPRDTSLQRVYVDWLKAGNNTGTGYGILLFDGDNIIERK